MSVGVQETTRAGEGGWMMMTVITAAAKGRAGMRAADSLAVRMEVDREMMTATTNLFKHPNQQDLQSPEV